jgi:pimeloyl-ACP methyl ester carboxylesterase
LVHARDCRQLVAALRYTEQEYDFAAYQMGGLIKDLVLRNVSQQRVGSAEVLAVSDEDITFSPNPNPSQWLFADLDRTFEHLVAATGSRATQFDVFGHSAGAQIAHRLVLCRPESRMRRVIAANAGFYRLPSLEEPLPTGLRDSGVTRAMLRKALQRELIVLLGEQDNSDGAGGTLLHTPRVDAQGLDRRSRGRHFFTVGRALATQEEVPLGWQLREVPGVGHDFRAMGAAARELLSEPCARGDGPLTLTVGPR